MFFLSFETVINYQLVGRYSLSFETVINYQVVGVFPVI